MRRGKEIERIKAGNDVSGRNRKAERNVQEKRKNEARHRKQEQREKNKTRRTEYEHREKKITRTITEERTGRNTEAKNRRLIKQMEQNNERKDEERK